MFLDSIFGLPSQIISTIGDVASGIVYIPGQIANTAGNTIGNVADSATCLLNNPLLIIGASSVLVMLLKD